ncbi:hypothetical protein [Pseudomonas sp. A6]|uniref:hypothetical protein n=1 Tax=Pseudomonas sp. A6 TaxID=410021 RepID=UPI0040259B9D
MKSAEYYRCLPESMSIEAISCEFAEVLEGVKSGVVSKEDALNALSELSDRQWNTYDFLNGELRSSIEDALVALWDGQSLGAAETIVSIVARLGLGRVLRFLSALDSSQVSPDVLKEIHEAVEELRDNIDDPYSGMRDWKAK